MAAFAEVIVDVPLQRLTPHSRLPSSIAVDIHATSAAQGPFSPIETGCPSMQPDEMALSCPVLWWQCSGEKCCTMENREQGIIHNLPFAQNMPG